MVDITVDAKPMPQNRIDPDVKIPDSVKRRSAAVDALYAQPAPPTPGPVQEAPITSAPATPQTAAPESAPQSPTPPPADSERQPQLPLEPAVPPAPPADSSSSENVTQATIGRNQALQRQLGEQQEQLEQLAQENLRLQQLLERGQPQLMPQAQSYLTKDDEKNFGPELLDVAGRAARHFLGPELERMRAENEELRR